jgi:hypothetical protein
VKSVVCGEPPFAAYGHGCVGWDDNPSFHMDGDAGIAIPAYDAAEPYESLNNLPGTFWKLIALASIVPR